LYQHHSPGIRIYFWSDRFNITPTRITGNISHAEYTTDPLAASLTIGNVSGSLHAELRALSQKVVITETISRQPGSKTMKQFQDCLEQNNLTLDSVAYTMDIRKDNFSTSGPANITLTIPASWVNQHGGIEAVRITRISDESGTVEMVKTVFTGRDPSGNMVFRGDSPNGASLFGLVSAQTTAAEQQAHPNATFIPASKPAMGTSLGMFGWLLDIMLNNPLLIGVVIALFAALVYYGWWKRRL